MIFDRHTLFHQVRPAKRATDIAASLVSLYLIGIILIDPAVHLFPPFASAAAMRFADLEPYGNSRLGDYHVTLHDARGQAARLAGDFAPWSPPGITS